MSEKWLARRKSPRRQFLRPVGVLRHGVYKLEMALEISEGGILLQTEEPLSAQNQIVISFIISGRAHVVVRGEVRYGGASTGGPANTYGIEFAGISFENRRAIRFYIADKSESDSDLPIVDPAVF